MKSFTGEGEKYYIIRSEEQDMSKNLSLEIRKNNLEITERIQLKSPLEKEKTIGIYKKDSILILFRTTHSLKELNNTVQVEFFNITNGQFLKQVKIASKTLESYTDHGEFLLTASPKNNQFLISFVEENEFQPTLNLISISIGEDFIPQRKVFSYHVKKGFEMVQAECNSSGNWAVLYHLPVPSFKEKYEYHVLQNSGDSLLDFIPFPTREILDLYITFSQNQKILIMGGLQGNLRQNITEGFLFATCNTGDTNCIIDIKYRYTDSFRVQLPGNGKFATNPLSNYFIRHLYQHNKGNYILILEQVNLSHQNQSSIQFGTIQTNVRTDFYFNEIIYNSITPEGNTLPPRVVDKSQICSTDNFEECGFFLYEWNQNSYFIYNKISSSSNQIILSELGKDTLSTSGFKGFSLSDPDDLRLVYSGCTALKPGEILLQFQNIKTDEETLIILKYP